MDGLGNKSDVGVISNSETFSMLIQSRDSVIQDDPTRLD